MDVRHLQLLRELADRGSVNAVAAATHRTPSAVSQQLRTAQRNFGAALVEPAGRGIRLTEAGLVLARGAIEIATAIERVQSQWEEFQHGPGGIVTIAAVPSAAELLVPGLLSMLAGTPIVVRCRDCDLAEDEFAALTNDHDIVICHSLKPHTLGRAETLTTSLLIREPLDIALPRDHPLATHEALGPEDVVDQDWIAVPEGYPFDTVRRDIEAATSRSMHVVQRIIDNRVVEALVAAGHGIAVLPRFTSRLNDRFVLRPLVGISAARAVIALSRPDKAQRGAVQQVMRTLHTVSRVTT